MVVTRSCMQTEDCIYADQFCVEPFDPLSFGSRQLTIVRIDHPTAKMLSTEKNNILLHFSFINDGITTVSFWHWRTRIGSRAIWTGVQDNASVPATGSTPFTGNMGRGPSVMRFTPANPLRRHLEAIR